MAQRRDTSEGSIAVATMFVTVSQLVCVGNISFVFWTSAG